MSGGLFDPLLVRWGCRAVGAVVATAEARLLPVMQGERPLMIKQVNPKGDETGAAAYLAALGGRFAVRLLAVEGPVMLMERVGHFGPTLEEMALGAEDAAAMGILCDVGLGMQAALRGADLPGLIPLDRRMQELSLAADALSLWALGAVQARLDDRSDWTALHGDLHHFNVLNDASRGWLAIDPKGIMGPPVYDLANAILNPFPQGALVHDPRRMADRAAQVAARFGVDEVEVLFWVCLHGCLARAWGDETGHWEKGARLAGRLAGLSLPG